MRTENQHAGPDLGQHDDLARRIGRLALLPADLVAERKNTLRRPADTLAALLREIDETVLPRDIALEAGGKTVARLAVSGRCVHGIASGINASADLTLTLEEAVAALLDLALTQGELKLHITRATQDADATSPKFSACALRDAMGRIEGVDPIELLEKYVMPRAQSLLVWHQNAGEPAFSGDESVHTMLESCMAEMRKLRDPAAAKDFRAEKTTGFAFEHGDQALVIVGASDARGVAAVLPKEAGLKAIETWQLISA